jgi:hypothetical protein
MENQLEIPLGEEMWIYAEETRKIVTPYDISVFEEKISKSIGMTDEFLCIFLIRDFSKKPPHVFLETHFLSNSHTRTD